MFVYLIVNAVNGKYYVGKTKSANLQVYFQNKLKSALKGRRDNPHLFAAIRKYGAQNFQIHVLFSSLISDQELKHWEQELIALFRATDPDVGYNITRGGEGGPGLRGRSIEQKQQFHRNGGYASWAGLTVEERSQLMRSRWRKAENSKPGCSIEAGKRGRAAQLKNFTAEELSQIAQKGNPGRRISNRSAALVMWESVPAEARSARSRKIWIGKSAQERSAIIKKGNETRRRNNASSC